MKQLLMLFTIFCSLQLQAQQTPTLYNPTANAATDIKEAVKKAKAQGKFVIIQAGGNWCKWCREFARFSTADKAIDSILQSNFVLYH